MATPQQSTNNSEFKPVATTAVSDTATACQLSCQTPDLPDPNAMTADEIADLVIEGFQKFNRVLPYVFALREKFREGDRDSSNRLKVPIKDCYTWSDFCLKHLDRTRQAIDKAIREQETSNRELAPKDLEAEHPEAESKTNPQVHRAAARGHRNGSNKGTPLQELQKLLSPLCASTVDGKEHRLIQVLRDVDATGVAEAETELSEIVAGMLRKIGNSLISSADRLESLTKIAEAA